MLNNMNEKKVDLKDLFLGNFFFLIFALYLIIIKYYFIISNPATLESYSVATNTQIFFNAKSFYLIPQSFVDWNHPGTPLYYITNLIFHFYKIFTVKNIYEFLLIFHIIFLILLVTAIYFFINYFKNFIEEKYIFLFLILISTFDTFILSLEVIDYLSLKLTLALILIIYFHKFIEKNDIQNLSIFIFFCCLANSIILSFLTITIPLSIAAIINIILKKKISFVKYFFLFNVIFLSILNIPILGRMPKIILNVIFTREDTRFEIQNIFWLIKNSFFYIKNNYLYFFLIIFIIFFKFILDLKKNKLPNKNKNKRIYLITSILIFLFFIYTILLASSANFYKYPIEIKGVGLRNIYISSIFIFFIFLYNKNLFTKSTFKIYFILSLIFFISTNIIYIKSRNILILELDSKEKILQKKINSNLKNYKTLAVYSDIGYGFGDYSIIARTNSILAGEKFNSEIFEAYPNLRYLRLHDIVYQIENKKFTINKYVIYADNIIKKYFPSKLHLILSPNSLNLTTTWVGSSERPRDIFIKINNFDKIDGIVISESIFAKYDFETLKKYIEKESNFNNFRKIKVRNDTWYIFF
jgi:hypothetical protein